VNVTLPALREMKLARQPIVMVTAYDHPSALIAEAAGVDVVFVGDSAAMVVLGHPSTVPATVDELLVMTAAVNRARRRAFLLADLPFLSYQVSDEEAMRNGGRFVKEAGADAVKLEGGGPSIDRIAALVGAGIPTCGHLGLTPQTATMLGGHKAQGRSWQQAKRIYDDAIAAEKAGAFMLVLECVPPPIAEAITRRLVIPTIGIGCGSGTDGQVLVWHDLLGLGPDGPTPRFVKRFAEAGRVMEEGVAAYAAEARERRYPGPEHTYAISPEQLSAFQTAVESERARAAADNKLTDW
jgi:3-methyl-2-oxobutanoate hydroxymethyltransferase